MRPADHGQGIDSHCDQRGMTFKVLAGTLVQPAIESFLISQQSEHVVPRLAECQRIPVIE